jgi:transcription initiation factor TFIID subunit 7
MTPSYGDPGKKPRNKPSAKKRAAEYDDYDEETPAPKRLAPESRKSSLILKTKKPSANAPSGNGLATPSSAGPRISLKKKRQPSAPVLRRLNVKGRVPDRAPGNAYDSEDSDREKDPATEQHIVLRMEPGEDATYLRDAINNKTIGVPPKDGGAEVTIRFVEREYRRAVITIKGRMYGAVLVDLPCIIETMKSWDKKGWWKVADMHQMLLVLGRCSSDEEAKSMPLPRGTVNPSTMQYAHGLTPPMHYVRKRRFRKRLSYKDTANIEEEVQKLLEEDEKAEREGGETGFEILNRESIERSVEPEYFDEDADGEAISTIEGGYDQEEQEEMDAAAAEAELQGLFDMDDNDESEPPVPIANTITASPAHLADNSASFAQVQAGLESTAAIPAPADTSAPSSDEDESDEDEDDDEDDIDVVDEDAAMKAAERAQQMEEINDLEREVEIQRQKLAGQKNQLLREKTMKQLRSLEEDLRIKKGGLGMRDEEDEE